MRQLRSARRILSGCVRIFFFFFSVRKKKLTEVSAAQLRTKKDLCVYQASIYHGSVCV